MIQPMENGSDRFASSDMFTPGTLRFPVFTLAKSVSSSKRTEWLHGGIGHMASDELRCILRFLWRRQTRERRTWSSAFTALRSGIDRQSKCWLSVRSLRCREVLGRWREGWLRLMTSDRSSPREMAFPSHCDRVAALHARLPDPSRLAVESAVRASGLHFRPQVLPYRHLPTRSCRAEGA